MADASVIVKWVFPGRENEADTDKALGLLAAIREGSVRLYQPPHWLAEVSAVIVRLSPASADADVADLYAMEFPVVDTVEVYGAACQLSRNTGHHVFDTLYHAVALTLKPSVLITADERYYRKARDYGGIMMLKEYSP